LTKERGRSLAVPADKVDKPEIIEAETGYVPVVDEVLSLLFE
jgi:hypothetical protein